MRRPRRHWTWIGAGVGPGDAATGGAAPGGRVNRTVTLGCAGMLAITILTVGCGAHNRSGVGTAPVSGGTVTYALPANVTPNYIFPFSPSSVFTVVNTDYFQYLMYRPLYWWGGNGLPYLNQKLSLAYLPTYNGQVVTIKLKPNLRWADGTFVAAKDVMFWLNMMRAEAHTNWGGYVPGGIPDNVRNIHAVGSNEIQLTVIGKYSPLWFTDNELSQITPLPQAWDRTGANTPSDCAVRWQACTAVFTYLNGLAANSATWARSPLWKVVDGPWQLTKYNSQGVLTFNRNPSYSLSVPKHHINVFIEIPFTTEQAEYNQLQAGGSNLLDVGFLPTVDAPVPGPGMAVGQNPVAGYRLQPVYTWGLSYMPYNFSPANPQVAIFDQQYFREAFQLLVNQAAIIQGALHGYGKVSTGTVGDAPPTKYLSPLARKGDPFPYNLGKAQSLLTHHGWRVHPGGITVCVNPGSGSGQCGRGVKNGAKLAFTMLFATGNAWVQSAMLQLKSNASLVGIQIELTGETFNQVVTTAANGCGTVTAPKLCKWELADWGEGWSYVPDYLPTGDELFQTGSVGNLGRYSNHANDRLVRATLQAPNLSTFLRAMYRWQDYLTQQLPVVLQPTAPAGLVESINSLHIGPQSPTLGITPEEWYYTR